jgi:DNA gyrase/topoisomerase IV subunit A
LPITLTLPLEQYKIPEELKKLREERKKLKQELDYVDKLIKVIQNCCEHPESEREYGNTCGRWEYTACKACGKEW